MGSVTLVAILLATAGLVALDLLAVRLGADSRGLGDEDQRWRIR